MNYFKSKHFHKLIISKRYWFKKPNPQWTVLKWIPFRRDIVFGNTILYFWKNDQNNVNPENGNERHITGNERHAKILKGYIFRTNLFLKNVTVGSKSRDNKQLADIKVIFKRRNLFLSLVDFFQYHLIMNAPIRVGYVF